MDKLVEHYGIVVGESTIRQVTLHHAQAIHHTGGGFPQGLPDAVAPQQTFVAEIDGTMVPTVRTATDGADRRKGKSVQWQEAKVSLAHAQGSTELVFGATLLGDVDTAGRQLRACAKRAGFGKGHRVHGVGDGAPWIANQMRQRFGSQGSYLLDFYHVCDLSQRCGQSHRAAACGWPTVAEDPAGQAANRPGGRGTQRPAASPGACRRRRCAGSSASVPPVPEPTLAATGLQKRHRPGATHRVRRN